jgi:hypothetical protein
MATQSKRRLSSAILRVMCHHRLVLPAHAHRHEGRPQQELFRTTYRSTTLAGRSTPTTTRRAIRSVAAGWSRAIATERNYVEWKVKSFPP